VGDPTAEDIGAGVRVRASSAAPGVRLRWGRPTPGGRWREPAVRLLTADERARWDSIPLPDRRDRFLLGRLLLRQATAELCGVPIDAVIVRAECPRCGGPHGRPIIEGVSGRAPRASLSSTSGLVVAAVVPAELGTALGIDVEAASSGRERRAAIDGLLPPARWAGPGSASSLRRWTRTEAVLKADGRGLRVEPRQVSVRRVGGRLVASVGDEPVRYDVADRRIGGIGGGARRGSGAGAILSIAVARTMR
jgi:4'-phosphopantetheinyl transferase